MGIFGEWYIHPGPPIGYDDYPRELVLTNGKREQAYVPKRTCGLICHEVRLPDGLKEKGVEMRVYECGECGERMFSDYNYCPACGARVVE